MNFYAVPNKTEKENYIKLLKLQSWTKVLGHLRFWAVFQFTQVQPIPSPPNNVGGVYPEFFPSFNFV